MKTLNLVIGRTQYEIRAKGSIVEVFKVFCSDAGKHFIRVSDPAIAEVAAVALRVAA